ncbi:MAG: hypothetical protein ISR55_04995 [Bacteroidetes bacterium]|nr:hypothetical protein [Bacteroidota bacterium]MBL6963158.1 hypothetical protein [Bacteroidota bacterium]
MKAEGVFKHCMEDGYGKYFYENGDKKEGGSLDNGSRSSEWFYQDRNGEVSKKYY